MARMVFNETTYFGAGCRENLRTEFNNRGFKKAFVVTDVDLVNAGVCDMVTSILKEEKIRFSVFTDLKANPTIKNVQDGVDAFQESHADVIIAVGGGSVIDTAKGIGIVVANPKHFDVSSLEGEANTRNKSVPLIAFATTAGTAAEVTINYVITDESKGRKLVCVDPNDIPVLSFNDAEMMISMPASLTASTGMDALTHAIEGYITPGANPLSDMLCWNSIKLIADNLQNAVEDGSNIAAREGMALGSYTAGMAFSNVGLGIVHSMAHPLGARFDIAHGVANAILLPYVMEFNKTSSLEKYADIAKAMGGDVDGMTELQKADLAIELVKDLSKSIGIPEKLSEIGLTDEYLEILANDAFVDPCTGGNPKAVTAEDILEIYKKAL